LLQAIRVIQNYAFNPMSKIILGQFVIHLP